MAVTLDGSVPFKTVTVCCNGRQCYFTAGQLSWQKIIDGHESCCLNPGKAKFKKPGFIVCADYETGVFIVRIRLGELACCHPLTW